MGKKAAKWAPSKKELEKILEKKFNIHADVLDDGQFMWYQKFLILEKSGKLKGNVKNNAL